MTATCLTPRWYRVLHWIQRLRGLKQQNELYSLISLQQKDLRSILGLYTIYDREQSARTSLSLIRFNQLPPANRLMVNAAKKVRQTMGLAVLHVFIVLSQALILSPQSVTRGHWTVRRQPNL